jgi:signal transduction histidine kinase/tetratricopeptide (TPR) repeat protein
MIAFPKFSSGLRVSAKKRRRIILLFVLGIVLPSLLLGYLAFRGIQNDLALLEQARLYDHRRIAEQVVSLVDEKIKTVEQAFSETVKDPQKAPPGELANRLKNLIDKHPLVEQVFCFQDFETIRFPAAKLLYVADGHRPSISSPARPSSVAPKILSAQRLEFQQRNFPQALKYYQQAIEQGADQDIKGELLNAVARVQKKSALFKDAISTYEKIARDFGRVVISDGLPLGLAARIELGSLFRTISDYSSSLATFLDLYKSLIDREWTLEKAPFEFYARRVKDSIREIFSNPPSGLQLQSYMSAFQNLEEEEREQRDHAERVLAFQENAAPNLEAKISGTVAESADAAMRLNLELGKHSYLVSILRPTGRMKDRVDGTWGVILNADVLRENLLRPALHQYVSPEERAWIVKGRDGRLVLTSEKPPTGTVTVRANFAANFPDWSLEFYQPPPRLLNTLLISRQGLYFYMFLLITGILIFGLTLTVRAVSHELELARMKSDFVSTISHEFKSPLTSIRQIVEMLHAGRVPSEERRRQYYDVLLEQSERLSLLTENILNLARMEEGRKQFEFEKTDMAALLQEVVSYAQDRVRHEGFSIELEIKKGLPMIMLDRSAITQAITNLMDNAVKYSGESRRVIVSASDEGALLHIAVKDFGIGIRKEDRDRVFERFFRGGDELTRTVKGSGLGLTLVREIVEAHQGTVYAVSEPGKGSTFLIRLPLPKDEER